MSFEALFNSASLGIIVANENGRIVRANPFLLQQFCYNKNELLGEPIEKLIPSRFHNLHRQHVAGYNQHPKKRPMGLGLDLCGVRKDGSEFFIEVSLGKFDDEHGRFTIAFVSDISGRKRAEQALISANEELEAKIEQRTLVLRTTIKDLAQVVEETQAKDRELNRVNAFFNNIWHHAEPIMYVTDEHGILKMFNPTAEKQLGYKASEVIDRMSPLIFHEPHEMVMRAAELSKVLKKEIKPDFSVLAASEIRELSDEREFTFIRKDCSPFQVSLSFNAMHDLDGNINGYLGIAIDISKRKKAEADLKLTLKKEKEVSELKSRFVSMASHEFRTPLSTILSSAFLISRYRDTHDHEKREKHVNRIISAVKMLTGTLEDFLSVDRIEAGKIQVCYSAFDLKENIQNLTAQFSDILKKDQIIKYTHQGKKNVLLDPKLMEHILMNLVSNAIKFSNEGSVIEIKTSSHKNSLKISVADQGIGISEQDQLHLFERFFRAGNVSNIQGTGLGLHIIRNYTELMNGNVRCKSEVEKGTTFEVLFNLHPQE